MDFLATILAIVLAWPILIGVALTAIVLILLATEHEVFSTLVVGGVAVLAFLAFKQSGQPFEVSTIVKWVCLYFVIGFVFTLPKWYLWVQRMGRKFIIERKKFPIDNEHRKAMFFEKAAIDKLSKEERMVYHNRASTSDEHQEIQLKMTSFADECKTEWDKKLAVDFQEYWNKYHSKSVMKIRNDQYDVSKVEVYYEKSALVGYLTSWIIHWPFYLVLLLLEDFIIEIVNWFADRVGKTFRNIATRAFNPVV